MAGLGGGSLRLRLVLRHAVQHEPVRGANYDQNAYPPFKAKLLNSNRLLDLNTAVFTVQAALLGLSLILVVAA